MEKLIILGAGPAGLTAGIYAARSGISPLIIERLYAGGQMANTPEIENYPGIPHADGVTLSEQMRAHAEGLGVRFRTLDASALTRTDGGFTLTTDEGELTARTVIAATGASKRKLGVPGEAKYAGRGVSYCATCDGSFFKGQACVVIGGGDAAAEDALYLAGVAGKVTLAYHESALRCERALIEQLKDAGVRMLLGVRVTEIYGSQAAEGVRFTDADGNTRTVEARGVFIAVGSAANSELLRGLLETDAAGRVKAGEDCATDVPGLYVAGDVREKPLYQIVTACADGANAARQAAAFLRRTV
jgi:thioredoxin reductase (NADPH)